MDNKIFVKIKTSDGSPQNPAAAVKADYDDELLDVEMKDDGVGEKALEKGVGIVKLKSHSDAA